MAQANLKDRFLDEVIWAFADADGAIPMRRGDVYTLARELGWTSREADVMAFGPLTVIAGETPEPIDTARTIVAGAVADHAA
jgi:hypothetical protein